MAKIVALQMTSSPDVESNLAFVEQQLKGLRVDHTAVEDSFNEPILVVLPECFACFGAGDKALLNIAETRGDGPIQQRLSQLAKDYNVWLAAGSFPLKSTIENKYSASCLLFDDHGEIHAEYQKIHLFDVQVADNTGTYLESRHTKAGNTLVVVDSPFGKLGLAICYDVRFAGMFQAMSELTQLDVLALPAAFTKLTGEAHWHNLIKARAIENQCYVVAANQTGEHTNKRQTYGHSCIISPWGETLAELPEQTGTISANLDFNALASIRKNMPMAQHNKFRSYLV